MFAGLGCLDEGADDAAVFGGAVEDLFDGDHVGIGGSLFEKLHDRLERFVGMVKEQVASADGVKNSGFVGIVDDLGGGPGFGFEFFESRDASDGEVGAEVELAGDEIGVGGGGLAELLDGFDEGGRDVGFLFDFESDGAAGFAGVEDVFHLGGDVEGALVVEGDVGVAADAEAGGPDDAFFGEVGVEVEFDDVFDVDVGVGAGFGGRQGDVPWEAGGEDEDGASDEGFFIDGLAVDFAHQDEQKGGQDDGWLVGFDGDGREDGGDLFVEVILQVGALGGSKFVGKDAMDAVVAQGREEVLIEQGVLFVDELERALADGGELLAGG